MDGPTADGPTAPLAGVRVVDAATLFAGPLIATILGEQGADTIKVEPPSGDTLRGLGHTKNGVNLWWAVAGRNKRSVTLDLSQPAGADVLKRMLARSDVFVEGFRPGRLEAWGLGPDELHAVNPRLVIVRVSGFGQTGPYRSLPGFGTLAEAMSGFANLNGHPDGPPTLPPLPLADSVAALTGAYAVMVALWRRERTGVGDVVDLAIYEPLFWIQSPQVSVYQQLDIVPRRTGNENPFIAPRNVYETGDGKWVAVSASAPSIARRVFDLLGRPDLLTDPGEVARNPARRREIDEAVAAWIAERDCAEVVQAFGDCEAAIAPVLDAADILADPHFAARGSVTEVDHPVLGPLKMQGQLFHLGSVPARPPVCGPELGAHTREVLCGELGLAPAELARLERAGIVRPAHGPGADPDRGSGAGPAPEARADDVQRSSPATPPGVAAPQGHGASIRTDA